MALGSTAEARPRLVFALSPLGAGGMALWHCLTLHSSPPNLSQHPRRAIVFEYKDPSARLLGGSFSPNEVRPAGLMVRGQDPSGALLSAI